MIFIDANIQAHFDSKGFCVLENFLSNEQLLQIDKLYKQLNILELKEIYSNIKDKETALNELVDKTLVAIYQPSLNKVFKNYRTGGGAFLVKGTGESSVSSLHQDWNVVDESLYQSMCVWCPLIDVNENNGCIQVVEGTHKWFNSIRSINMPSVCINFADVSKLLRAVPLKRGSAVVFAHNIFHGSLPNQTNVIRPAASVSVLSSQAKLIHYYKVNEGIDILNADNFFNDVAHRLFDNSQDLSKLKVLKKIMYKDESLVTYKSFMKKYRQKTGIFSFLHK